jgi:AcrR family transcriptional regulator
MHPVKGSPGKLHSTEDALILAATHCFSSKGFGATSIQDIATTAGVAKGNVYHYFSSKDDVLRLILHRVLDELLGGIDDIPYAELDPVEQFRAFMCEMVGLVGRNRPGVAIFVQERRRLAEPFFADALARSQQMPERLTALLERGVAQGAFRSLPSPRTMALGLIGMATWAYQWYQPGRMSLHEIGRMYADLVIDGLRVGEPADVPQVEPTTAAPAADGAPSTRDALVRAALDLFVERGYDSTSISNLSVRAGVTTGAFYSQFSSKDEILRHLDNHFLDRILASTDGISAPEVSASESIAKLISETIGPDGDHQAERMVFLNEFRFFDTESFADVREKSVQFLDRFVFALEKGKREGEFRSVAAPRPIAAGLVGMCSFPFQWTGPGGSVEAGTSRMYAEVILNGLRGSRG